VEQSDDTARREDEELASTRYPTSARLLAAIHRGDEAAIRELFLLYAPLLRDQARRLGIEPDRRSEFVTTLLDDAVIHLMEYQIAPRNLARYLVASLRNRARNRHRDSHRRRAARENAYGEHGTANQRIVAECHSAYGLRASTPFDAAASDSIRGPIARLAEESKRRLSAEEIRMLVCLGRHMPLREIAAQLGISYVAARVRLHRLRERFRKIAIEHVASLKVSERRELERFFRRAEVSLTRGVAAKQPEGSNGKH
jgi:DNA-directed RNA polymerase specialized sigma24 family protein